MAALHDIITKGSADRSVTLRCLDATTGAPKTDVVYNSAGIDLWYRREGSDRVAVTEATLADLEAAHTDGGFLHVSDGEYRLDLPDAAFASGANHVDFGGTVTGGVFIGGRVRLVDVNLETADSAGVTTLLSRLSATRAGYLDNLSAGAVALASTFSGITSLAQWLGLIACKQTGDATARTELRATGAGSGTFDETTDSQEALRERGDAAWVTATGFSTLDASGVQAAALAALTAYDPPTKGELDGAVAPLATASDLTAVKAKTDQFAFSNGAVDANVARVNDIELAGTGAVGVDEWRAAA